jgi:hypothetical protein
LIEYPKEGTPPSKSRFTVCEEVMADKKEKLIRRLTWIFGAAITPVLLFFALDVIIHQRAIQIPLPFGTPRLWGILVLILSVLCGIALPILMRAGFQTRAARTGSVDLENYTALQIRLIVVSMAAALLACVAYLFVLPKLYLYGSVLAGLYGIYSVIPSNRKINADLRYYGLQEKETP